MQSFKIQLNPGNRPTTFEFTYFPETDQWKVWQRDEKNSRDLVGQFTPWIPDGQS